jgi:predicted nucleic acid-binding protein
MMAEAARKHVMSRSGLVSALIRRPSLIQQLSDYLRVPSLVAGGGITVHPVTLSDVESACALTHHFGLLMNDALIVATMQRLDIQWLATCDDDFDRVPWIETWKPTAE